MAGKPGPALVSVGAITGAHGVRGEVKLRSFTSIPEDVASYGPLTTGTGAVIEIAKLRPQTNGFIAVLKGVTDRNQAEALKGSELFVPRERLPEIEADEVYLDDLVGLPVFLADGAKLGDVVALANFGAGDLLDVKREGTLASVYVPFAEPFLVDADANKIVVDLPEGFLDDASP